MTSTRLSSLLLNPHRPNLSASCRSTLKGSFLMWSQGDTFNVVQHWLSSPKARATTSSMLRDCSRVSRAAEDENMRKERPILMLVLCFAISQTVGCKWLSRPNVSGVWRGSIEGTDNRGHKWQGPAELTLNQNGDAITGTLVFTPPQAGR